MSVRMAPPPDWPPVFGAAAQEFQRLPAAVQQQLRPELEAALARAAIGIAKAERAGVRVVYEVRRIATRETKLFIHEVAAISAG
jgi:hypothetical protein